MPKRIYIQSLNAEVPVWMFCRLLARYMKSYPQDGVSKTHMETLSRGGRIDAPKALWIQDAFAALTQDLRLSMEEIDELKPMVVG